MTQKGVRQLDSREKLRAALVDVDRAPDSIVRAGLNVRLVNLLALDLQEDVAVALSSSRRQGRYGVENTRSPGLLGVTKDMLQGLRSANSSDI